MSFLGKGYALIVLYIRKRGKVDILESKIGFLYSGGLVIEDYVYQLFKMVWG